MTTLSRLTLERRNPTAIRDLGDPADMHRTLMRAFPKASGDAPRQEFGVLFRVEHEHATVIVQSQVDPDWGLLPAAYTRHAESKGIEEVIAAIPTGRVLRFLLVANPTKKVRRQSAAKSGSRNSARVELTSDEARYEWLTERASGAGFVLAGGGPFDGVRIDRLREPTRGGASGVTIKTVRFEGLLRVTDPASFAAGVRDGIGPGKAYGCGLLSLAPA